MIIEAFLTFVLCQTVLNAAVDTKTNALAPLAIGFTLTLDILAW
jgi:glycerol uptake facilitator-like aquaporin